MDLGLSILGKNENIFPIYIYMTKNDNAIIMNTSGVIKYSGSLDVNIHKIVKSGFLSGFTVLGDNDFRGIVLK